jgi:predicted dehydrogenase
LGNNGIHALDLARWGLQVDCPSRVTCGGGRYHYDDDQETPDTYITTYDFGGSAITWEGHSCDPHGFEGARFGVNFYGDDGTMIIAGNDCRILDPNDKLVREIKNKQDDTDHFKNFLDCIRDGKSPNSDIEEGQKGTLLCHLGNIAYRTGRTLNMNPQTKSILDDPDAQKLWSRDYREGWQPKV